MPTRGYSTPDWDGVDDEFSSAWLDSLLSTVDGFVAAHNVPVAVNEFGVTRWVPGAAEFMRDQIRLLEDRGMNHALWLWEVSWPPYSEEVDAFNLRQVPSPAQDSDVESSDLMEVIVEYRGRNSVRPSLGVSTGGIHLPIILR